MPIRPRTPRKEVEYVNKEDVEVSLHRYLVGSRFLVSYIEELRRTTATKPPDEEFQVPKAYDINTIKPSKRVKPPVHEPAPRTKGYVGPTNDRDKPKPMILDERINAVEARKALRWKEPVELEHKGFVMVISGGLLLHWNSETDDFWIDGGGTNVNFRQAHLVSKQISSMYNDGFELEDIVSETFWAIRNAGLDVYKIFVNEEDEDESI